MNANKYFELTMCALSIMSDLIDFHHDEFKENLDKYQKIHDSFRWWNVFYFPQRAVADQAMRDAMDSYRKLSEIRKDLIEIKNDINSREINVARKYIAVDVTA